MMLIVDSIVVTFEMIGIFFSAFFIVFLLTLFLSPIENRLSKIVWEHSSHEKQMVVAKSSFKEFSQKHR
jgi:predicted membrane protein